MLNSISAAVLQAAHEPRDAARRMNGPAAGEAVAGQEAE